MNSNITLRQWQTTRVAWSLFACVASLSLSAGVAHAAPFINIALLARPSGTTTAFSSTIINPAINTTWDYEVAVTLLTPTSPIANASLTTQIAGYNTSTASALTGDGWVFVDYLLRQTTSDATQVTFDYANAGNANAYSNYPGGITRPELNTPSNSYRTTNQSSGGVVFSPASPASPGFTAPTAVAYNLTGTNGGTPVDRGNGNFDMGNTTSTAAFAGRTGGDLGIASANTPVQGLLAGNGDFTITSVGLGNTTSTISPTWQGMQTSSNLVTIRYRNGSATQVFANLTVSAQQQGTGGFANGTDVADPIFSVTPLSITTAVPEPSTLVLGGLGLLGLLACARKRTSR